MPLDLWQPAQLIEIQQDRRAPIPTGFWSGLQSSDPNAAPLQTIGVFDREVTFDTQTIYFDQLRIRDRRLAPFVAPNVQGRVMAELGAEMASFRPAYLKPKHTVTPDRTLFRRPGESYNGLNGGLLSLEERWDQIIAQNMLDERLMIERRWDWMAAMGIIYGMITIVGEDYPLVTVDYKRDPSLTITNTGTACWDQVSTADPLDDLGGARAQAFNIGQSPIRTFVFGSLAWKYFIKNSDVLYLLNTFNRGSTSGFNSSHVTGGDTPVEYKGFIEGIDGGRVDMWVYINTYWDDNGVAQPYLDPHDVIGVGPNVQGVRCFGAILDKRAGLASVPMFPKMWDEEDPSRTYTMTQSAPLMVVGNPDNTFRLRAVNMNTTS